MKSSALPRLKRRQGVEDLTGRERERRLLNLCNSHCIAYRDTRHRLLLEHIRGRTKVAEVRVAPMRNEIFRTTSAEETARSRRSYWAGKRTPASEPLQQSLYRLSRHQASPP